MKALGKTGALLALALFCFGCSPKARQSAAPSPPPVAYVASDQREPFHRTTCAAAQRITPAHLQQFAKREDAIAAGHRPCEICRP